MTLKDIMCEFPPGMGRREAVSAIPKLMVSLGEVTAKSGDTAVFKSVDMSTIEYILLHTLIAHETSPTMTELRKKLLRSPANLTKLVDKLESNGWIHRVASVTDRRVNLIKITEAGRVVTAEAEKLLSDRMEEFFESYSDEDITIFLNLLTRFGNDMLSVLGIEGDFASQKC